MSERESVVVWSVDEPTVVQDKATYVCVDPRPNDNGTEDGHVEMSLTNGRRLLIGAGGIWDLDDVGDRDIDEVGVGGLAFVPWEELLQLLDGWREMNRQEQLN